MTAKSDSKPYGVIYCITNTVNGKKYIGQTTGTISYRWSKHCGSGRQCRVLRNAIDKYGKDSFTVAQIDSAGSKQELDAKEIFHISQNSADDRDYGYNIAPGGAIGKHAKETCDLISKALTGKPLTEAHCAKLSASHMGHKRSAESRAKQSATATGSKRPKTAEHITKIAAANRGKKRGPMSESHKAKIGAANKLVKRGPLGDAQRKKIGDAHRGVPKVVSPEAKVRMAEMLRNRECSAATRQKMAMSQTGKVQSKETIEKRAKALTGLKRTEETKRKMSEAATGKVMTEAHRASLRAASKLRWEKYRLEKAAQI